MRAAENDHVWTGFCCERHTYLMIDAAFQLPLVATISQFFFSFSLYLSSMILPRREFLAALDEVHPDERMPRIYRTACYRAILDARLSSRFRQAWERRTVVVLSRTLRGW